MTVKHIFLQILLTNENALLFCFCNTIILNFVKFSLDSD